ncbi:MAG TPA: hypothetical protein VM432_07395 [Bdellovibrionales bacterium]|nr:hypothetical protein [Bdellovibrionales bacterium]
MRHFLPRAAVALVIFGISHVLAIRECEATPVFKRIDSRFSSGDYSRQWLEDHIDGVQMQQWYQVETDDKRRGWIAEDHILTPLKLVSEATLTEDAPLRSSPSLDDLLPGRVLKKATSVLILEVLGSWARTQPLPASENQESWIPTDLLQPKVENGGSRAFVHTSCPLFVMPGQYGRQIETIDEQTYVDILSEKKDWFEVRTRTSTGFVEKRNLWSARDLNAKAARPALLQTPLRSEASPTADLVANLGLGTKLSIVSSKALKWGRVKISSLGTMWWPIMEDEAQSKLQATDAPTIVRSEDLFKRKIFDMAASQTIPSLKFLSADGVYRTLDNDRWTKIPTFKNENYPIAIAKNGSVFVGPYRSDNHGETFQQWIRWDGLVSSLRRDRVRSDKVRIAEIRPDDEEGRQITLRLSTADGQSIRLRTHDGGRNWSRF